MDFQLSQDQTELRDAVRDYLTAEHGPEVLRRLDAGSGRDPAIWEGLVAMGLTSILVSPKRGGLGFGLVEAALVAVELGRANVSEPLADTALIAAPLLTEEQQERIAAGELKVALAHPINPWVADLDQADLVLGAERPSSPAPLESVDPLRRLFAGAGAAETEGLLDRAALIAAAQLIGGSEWMLSLSKDYAVQRVQFGHPIGRFQAIKHHLATVATALEFAKPLVLRAAYALQHGHGRAPLHVSHAKVAATDTAMLASEVAIQVHGAMGYTYEVDLHFWMKRAWALSGAWGDRAFHAQRIEHAVLDGGVEIGPSVTFSEE
jgi:alkylation response protein AidB-like acyl-CoA dehydrogenase